MGEREVDEPSKMIQKRRPLEEVKRNRNLEKVGVTSVEKPTKDNGKKEKLKKERAKAPIDLTRSRSTVTCDEDIGKQTRSSETRIVNGMGEGKKYKTMCGNERKNEKEKINWVPVLENVFQTEQEDTKGGKGEKDKTVCSNKPK